MTYPTALTSHFQALNDPESTLGRHVDSIISSYNSPWDILTELVQNSVDAIFERKRRDANFLGGKIAIEIDSANLTLMIEDNGTGIPSGKYVEMILPGGSLKIPGNAYGHKGLGFTYCAHIADSVEVETNCDDGSHDHWEFRDGFSWVNDRTSSSTILNTSMTGSIRTIQGYGTSVKLKLAVGRYEQNRANTAVLDKFFTWADDEKLLSFVLRTRTGVGQTFGLLGKTPPVDIEVKVTLKSSNTTFVVPYSFFDFYSHAPLSNSQYPKAIDYANNVYLSASVLHKTHFGIHHVFDTDPSNNPPVLKAGVHKGGVVFSAYVYCCGKENLASALTQYDHRLDDEFRYLAISTDVHMSIDGMPCGVPIDSWNNFGGFEQRYFCIVDAQRSFGTVLDAGRKTVTRHYVDLFTNKIIELTKTDSLFSGVSFYSLSQQLNNRRAVVPPASAASIINDWRTRRRLGCKSLLLDVVPHDELAVYLIFGELVGKGLLPGWKALYVSGSAVYDAAMEFRYDFSDLNTVNSTTNGGNCLMGPGVSMKGRYPRAGDLWKDPSGARQFLVVECKVSAEDLLKEVQTRRSAKEFSQIDVLICFTIDQSTVKALQGSAHKVTPSARPYSGVTHELQFGGNNIQVICLQDVISELVGAKIIS